jgi:hypothetical protein
VLRTRDLEGQSARTDLVVFRLVSDSYSYLNFRSLHSQHSSSERSEVPPLPPTRRCKNDRVYLNFFEVELPILEVDTHSCTGVYRYLYELGKCQDKRRVGLSNLSNGGIQKPITIVAWTIAVIWPAASTTSQALGLPMVQIDTCWRYSDTVPATDTCLLQLGTLRQIPSDTRRRWRW